MAKRKLKLGGNQKAENIEILKQGQDTEFWELVLEAIRQNISFLESELKSDGLRGLPADSYKLESENLKAKINYLQKLEDLPEVLIAKLQDPEIENFNFDPYSSGEESEED